MYFLDVKSNPPIYWRELKIDLENESLYFSVEILASEFVTKEKESAARKHAELRIINEMIAGLEDYKNKHYK